MSRHFARPTEHRHIVAVGTRMHATHLTTTWTMVDVLAAMDSGDRFYTHVAGDSALVERFVCRCGFHTVRSSPNAALANGLCRIRECAAEPLDRCG